MLLKSFAVMTGLLIVLLLWAGPQLKPSGPFQNVAAAESHSFYVDSEHGADSNPGTQVAPWKTLKNVDGRTLAPGDTIYFARGSSFTGGFLISSSGSRGPAHHLHGIRNRCRSTVQQSGLCRAERKCNSSGRQLHRH